MINASDSDFHTSDVCIIKRLSEQNGIPGTAIEFPTEVINQWSSDFTVIHVNKTCSCLDVAGLPDVLKVNLPAKIILKMNTTPGVDSAYTGSVTIVGKLTDGTVKSFMFKLSTQTKCLALLHIIPQTLNSEVGKNGNISITVATGDSPVKWKTGTISASMPELNLFWQKEITKIELASHPDGIVLSIPVPPSRIIGSLPLDCSLTIHGDSTEDYVINEQQAYCTTGTWSASPPTAYIGFLRVGQKDSETITLLNTKHESQKTEIESISYSDPSRVKLSDITSDINQISFLLNFVATPPAEVVNGNVIVLLKTGEKIRVRYVARIK